MAPKLCTWNTYLCRKVKNKTHFSRKYELIMKCDDFQIVLGDCSTNFQIPEFQEYYVKISHK